MQDGSVQGASRAPDRDAETPSFYKTPTLDLQHQVQYTQAGITTDAEGRVWATLDGTRRCLFQAIGKSAVYRFPRGGLDALIGTVEVQDNQIILTLSL